VIIGSSVTYDSRIVAWHDQQPYLNAVISLEEDPVIHFHSNLPGVPVHDVPVGAAVIVDFIEVTPGQLIPEWKLA
tara:strand:- start:287 stop:511 length:225 start_codon:yes stop_codon:yes gene_type:complete